MVAMMAVDVGRELVEATGELSESVCESRIEFACEMMLEMAELKEGSSLEVTGEGTGSRIEFACEMMLDTADPNDGSALETIDVNALARMESPGAVIAGSPPCCCALESGVAPSVMGGAPVEKSSLEVVVNSGKLFESAESVNAGTSAIGESPS